MAVELSLAPHSARDHIESMMEHYLADLGATGAPYPHLDRYWQESTRHPYIVLHGEQVVGFALVRQFDEEPSFDLVEFYIAAGFRNRGFGRQAAEALFKLHPGRWSVAVLRSNSNAQAFWMSVLSTIPSVTTLDSKAPEGIVYKFFSETHDA
jgi:predicted acetyltransferase